MQITRSKYSSGSLFAPRDDGTTLAFPSDVDKDSRPSTTPSLHAMAMVTCYTTTLAVLPSTVS